MRGSTRAAALAALLLAGAVVALWLPRMLSPWLAVPSWESQGQEWARRSHVANALAAALVMLALVIAMRRLARGSPRGGVMLGALAVGGTLVALAAAGPWFDDASLERMEARYTSPDGFHTFPIPGMEGLDAGIARPFGLSHVEPMQAASPGAIASTVLPHARGDLWLVGFSVGPIAEAAEAPRLVALGFDCFTEPQHPGVRPQNPSTSTFHHATYLCAALTRGESAVRFEGEWAPEAEYTLQVSALPAPYLIHASHVDEAAFALGLCAALGAATVALGFARSAAIDGRRRLDGVAAMGIGGASLAWAAALASRAEVVGTGAAPFFLLALLGASTMFALAFLWWRAPHGAKPHLALVAGGSVVFAALAAGPLVARAAPGDAALFAAAAFVTACIAVAACWSWLAQAGWGNAVGAQS